MSDATPSGDWSRSAAAQRQYNLVGGAILAVAGLVLFATSFLLQNPVPLTVRGSIVIFIAVGIAISAGLLRVQNPQDVYGGMALILLSLIAFVASNDLPGMRGFAFGPGTAPRLFAFTLAHAVARRRGRRAADRRSRRVRLQDPRRHLHHRIDPGVRRDASGRSASSSRASARMVICAAAAEDVKWRETMIVAAVVTAFCCSSVSLWLEPAVPALAAVLVIGENDHV